MILILEDTVQIYKIKPPTDLSIISGVEHHALLFDFFDWNCSAAKKKRLCESTDSLHVECLRYFYFLVTCYILYLALFCLKTPLRIN